MQGVVALLALQRDLGRPAIGGNGILPGADPREDVRRHMQRMRRIRRDAGVALRAWQAFLRDRWRVVGVDQVMRDARMVRVFSELLLEDRRRLERVAIGLVGALLDGDQVERIENLRFVILRILGGERLVGLGARERPLPLGAVGEVIPVRRHRLKIILFALALRAEASPLGDRALRPRHFVRRHEANERVVHQDGRKTPRRNGGARRILGRDFLEGALSFRPPKGMQHRHAALHLRLRLRVAGVREIHLADLLRPPGRVFLVRHCGDREQCCKKSDELLHDTSVEIGDGAELNRAPSPN